MPGFPGGGGSGVAGGAATGAMAGTMVSPGWGTLIGAGIGAGAGLLGGALSGSAERNRYGDQTAFAREQLQFQRDLAKSGITWRVEDAKNAGIHPLYAMGAPTMSSSPISVSGGSPGSFGRAISGSGQNISRAIRGTMNARGVLENRLLESQIRGQDLDNMGPSIRNRAELRSQSVGRGVSDYRATIPYEPLPAVEWDSEGNRIVTLPTGRLRWPGRYSTHEQVEELFGDLASEVIMAPNIPYGVGEGRKSSRDWR